MAQNACLKYRKLLQPNHHELQLSAKGHEQHYSIVTSCCSNCSSPKPVEPDRHVCLSATAFTATCVAATAAATTAVAQIYNVPSELLELSQHVCHTAGDLPSCLAPYASVPHITSACLVPLKDTSSCSSPTAVPTLCFGPYAAVNQRIRGVQKPAAARSWLCAHPKERLALAVG